jgi:Tol biopolymer transport system component/DNA-binding winged helix-turn-helix (wHTH) protein
MNEIKSLYKFSGFKFDAQTNTLWREDDLIQLSPKALELLKLLIERRGEIVSKQEIFDKVWADTFVEEGVLTQNIYTLRQALGTDENGKQLIENIARKGYRLSVAVVCEDFEAAGRRDVENTRRRDEATERLSENAENSGSPSRRRFVSTSILIALVLVAVAYGGYRYFSSNSTETPKLQSSELKFKQLTDTGDTSYLTVSPDGNLVAYTRGLDVFLRNLQTDGETKINIENAQKPGCLQFSPAGNSIFFGTLNSRDKKGSIFRVSPSGGIAEEITDNVWTGFSLSPDGKELAFVRKFPNENKQSLIIKNLATNTEKPLKTLSLPEEFYWNNYPAWSSDGKKIAMVAVNQTEHFSRLFLIDRETASETEIKPNFRNIEQIVWNADGNSLIISANADKNFQLWKLSIADGSVKRITNDLNSYLGIAVSNDRKQLVSRQRIYFSNIWIAKKDDLNNLKQITNGTSRNDGLNGLAWIDEEKIVYTGNDDKIRDWNLQLLNIADGSKQKLTSDSEIQNDNPTVSPDKKTIYFSSDRNKQSRIWQVETDGKNLKQTTFGEDETHHFPQVSPDGKFLYFIIKSGRSSTVGRKSLAGNSVQELSGKTGYVPGNFLSLSPDGNFLAFQNIGSEANSKFQLAIISTENPENVEFTEIEPLQQKIQWSNDGKFFDFVAGNVKQSGIMRQAIEKDAQPSQLLNVTETIIFNFAWSPSGENLAVSRGQLLRNAVLLTNFE